MKPASTITRITSWYAWAGLAMVVIIAPFGYFSIFYEFIAGSLETEAGITAGLVSQLISRDPDMWSFEQLRLEELLSRRSIGHLETRRIVDTKNRVVTESLNVLKPPVIMRSANLLDSGVVVARIEIYRSLRPLLLHTGIVALIGLLFGLITFVPLGALPIRAIRRAEHELRKSEERYRNLFDSTMDGVFRVNVNGVFTMMNQAGARIFGYETPEEIIGKNALEYWRDPKDRDVYREELTMRKSVSAYPMKARKKNGEPVELESSSRIIEGESGNFLGIEGILRDVTERKHMEEELRSLSLRDELTGLYNRRGFITLAAQQLKMADRLQMGIFILYADLDELKTINDTLGHEEGDRALKETAVILRETFRNADIIGRIGGDEFVIIPVGTAGDNLDVVTSRLQKNIDAQNETMNRNYKLSLSVGIAYYDPEHPITIDELLTLADALMYAQKRNKRTS